MQEGDQGTGFRRLRCGGGWNGSNRGQKYEEERRKDSDDIDLCALLFFFSFNASGNENNLVYKNAICPCNAFVNLVCSASVLCYV